METDDLQSAALMNQMDSDLLPTPPPSPSPNQLAGGKYLLRERRVQHPTKSPNLDDVDELELEQVQLVVRPSRIHGHGLFTENRIDRENFLGYYSGELIDEERYKREFREKPHLFRYLMKMEASYLNAAPPNGNRTRHINHSCKPNTCFRLSILNGATTVCVFALREICAGEELTANYLFDLDRNAVCKCGSSPTCSPHKRPEDGELENSDEEQRLNGESLDEEIEEERQLDEGVESGDQFANEGAEEFAAPFENVQKPTWKEKITFNEWFKKNLISYFKAIYESGVCTDMISVSSIEDNYHNFVGMLDAERRPHAWKFESHIHRALRTAIPGICKRTIGSATSISGALPTSYIGIKAREKPSQWSLSD